MSNQKALIPEVSQVEFFCDFTDATKQRLIVAVLYVVIDNLRDPEGEESQEIYALAYGYSGGQTQGDWLFGRDSYNSYWKYGDSSGDEWKGAKKIPQGGHLYDTEVEALINWEDQDSASYTELMKKWQTYFKVDSNENINVKEDIFNKYKESETRAISSGFDWDVLYDISPLWNFLVQYKDPYYN